MKLIYIFDLIVFLYFRHFVGFVAIATITNLLAAFLPNPPR